MKTDLVVRISSFQCTGPGPLVLLYRLQVVAAPGRGSWDVRGVCVCGVIFRGYFRPHGHGAPAGTAMVFPEELAPPVGLHPTVVPEEELTMCQLIQPFSQVFLFVPVLGVGQHLAARHGPIRHFAFAFVVGEEV